MKECTLDVEVFEPQPDCDTNVDPVVRFQRERDQEADRRVLPSEWRNSTLQIDLPLGSYVPEFKPRIGLAELKPSLPRVDPAEISP